MYVVKNFLLYCFMYCTVTCRFMHQTDVKLKWPLRPANYATASENRCLHYRSYIWINV